MAELVTMPKMSDTMTEGVIVKWHKKVGENVKPGDLVAEIETDKATMDYESFHEGTLLYLGAGEGETVPVEGVLAAVGKKGEDYSALLKKSVGATPVEQTPEQADKKETLEVKTTQQPTPERAVSSSDPERVKASPLAKKMAQGLNYNIAEILGSGEGGRVIKKDIENYIPNAAFINTASPSRVESPVQQEESHQDVPISQMRKTIARRLSDSMFTAPHFYLTVEINMSKAIEARESINKATPVKISFNDFVIKTAAVALRRHPDVNTSWLGDKIRRNSHIHIGVAVAVDDGLMVPVVRFADHKPLTAIATEVKDLAQRAHAKQLQPKEYEGSTFTISNLGMFGIHEFTAIINPPDACILAVGAIRETAVVKDGQIVPGKVMNVTLSSDHRVVDGMLGSKFLNTFKELLEDPVRMLA